jgi:arylformamidase
MPAVPDYARYAQFYSDQSLEARSSLECELAVQFGPTLDEYVDIFAAEDAGAPILIFFHGGYWHTFSSKEFSFVAVGPVAAGVTTLVPNYALCPRVTIDEIVRQSRAVVAWAYRNAESFGGDLSRIHVAGHSAGGHLVAMLMATDWETDYGLPPDIIKGASTISGLFDLAPLPYTYLQPKLQLTWGEVLRNSPILHIPDKCAPPLLVTYGQDETAELQRQSEDYLSLWRAKGLDAVRLPQSGKNHFSAIDGFLEEDSPLCAALLTLMNTRGG